MSESTIILTIIASTIIIIVSQFYIYNLIKEFWIRISFKEFKDTWLDDYRRMHEAELTLKIKRLENENSCLKERLFRKCCLEEEVEDFSEGVIYE